MGVRMRMIVGGLALVMLSAGPSRSGAQESAVFDMQEVSVFAEEPSQSSGLLQGGQYVQCGFEPDAQVKKSPELKSDRPLYGKVVFGGSPFDSTAGTTYFFIVDESGAGEPGEAKAGEGSSWLKGLAAALVGSAPLTRANTIDGKYDRLYFDANGDLDLTNDPVIVPMKDPPSRMGSSAQIVFDYLNVGFDHGPKLGTRTLQILPRLRVAGTTRPYMTFTAAVARRGKIKIAQEEYTALLTQSGMITGRFDKPFTTLYLMPVDTPGKLIRRWWGDNYLGSVRRIDDTLYQISATPTGDQLTVGPCRGETGVLRIGGPDAGPDTLGVAGVLVSKHAVLPLGDVTAPIPTGKAEDYRIPVGDYTPLYLSAGVGRLLVTVSQNPYAKDEPNAPAGKPPVYSLKIRKDQPFPVDFSDKPEVMFTMPPKDETFKPGDAIRLGAVIIDPALDLLLRGVQDTTQKTGEATYTNAEGEKVTVPRYASLDPTVSVKDSSGKQVAEGQMPFG